MTRTSGVPTPATRVTTMLLDLPTEVLTDILLLCDTATVTETCHVFAKIAYSVPSLWSSIYLGPSQCDFPGAPELLRTRLQRTGCQPLYISIGLISEATTANYKLCTILAKFSSRMRCLELSTSSPKVAGTIISDIFFSSALVFSELQILSVLVRREERVNPAREWPRLDVVLENATERFPQLQRLCLSSLYECIPFLPRSSYFHHLHTLILDGSMEDVWTDAALVAALLHCTPQLECLWMKHLYVEQWSDLSGPTFYGLNNVSTHIRLPHLTSLAVSVPGCASDLVYCIDAPALRDLHLDGSRGPFPPDEDADEDDEDDDSRINSPWYRFYVDFLLRSLKRFASRCQSVRHLAITTIYLTREGWDWLLFGDGKGPPFPNLESIAIHCQAESSGEIVSGFDDDLLLRFSREPRLPLRRLAILNSDFPLSGSAVVHAFKSIIDASPNEQYEFECDWYVPQFKDNEEFEELESLGVDVTCREIPEDEWWTYGHGIDGTDWFVY